MAISFPLNESERSSNTTKIETCYSLMHRQIAKCQKEVLTQQRLKPFGTLKFWFVWYLSERSSNTTKIETHFLSAFYFIVDLSERSSNTTKIETWFRGRRRRQWNSQKEVLTQQRLKLGKKKEKRGLWLKSERSSNTTKIETAFCSDFAI